MKILICGFMGAGKSTMLAKFNPNSLGFECLDLDDEIASRLGLEKEKLGNWIEQNGWEKFRKIESQCLQELLVLNQNLVIALGGGALTKELVFKIKNNPEIYLVHLDVPLEICLDRTMGDLNRPMLKLNKAEIESLYQKRHEIFSQAHLSLSFEEIKLIEGLETLVHNLSCR